MRPGGASKSIIGGVAVLLAMAAAGCAGSPSAQPATAEPTVPPATQGPLASANLPPLTDLEEAGAAIFRVEPLPDFAVVANGYLYVGGAGSHLSHIAKVDKQGKVVADLAIPGGTCGSLDVGFGAVWSMTCPGPGLARIDLATDAVTTVPVGPNPFSEASVGAGEGAVWIMVLGATRQLVKVDPVTSAIVASYPIDGTPHAVRAGLGGVWIADSLANVVHRFDPATERILASIAVGALPQFLAIGEGAVWTMNQSDGTVSRIDPATNTVTTTIAVGEVMAGGDISVGGGFVWVHSEATLLFKIDPATNTVVARYGPALGSGGVAADESALWVTVHDEATVWRLPLP